MQPKPGDSVIVAAVPPGFLDSLRTEDQQAVTAVIGKPILLKKYDDEGRAELEFTDDQRVIHSIYLNPRLVRNLTALEVLAKYYDEDLPDFCEPLTDVNQVGTFGNRPLHLACYRGNMKSGGDGFLSKFRLAGQRTAMVTLNVGGTPPS